MIHAAQTAIILVLLALMAKFLWWLIKFLIAKIKG
jgi:hypothetical protein